MHKSTALPAGAAAPDFALKSTPDQTVNLNDFRRTAGRACDLPGGLESRLRRPDGAL